MNSEIISNMQNKIEDLTRNIDIISKTVNALKINDQRRISSNNPIPPGIACKVSYDKNGLIIGGSKLEISDIPQLNIDKINNLKKYIDEKASSKDLEKFKFDVERMIKPAVDNLSEIIGTGIKVNYNSDGRIVSVAELLPSDIPLLPISKIEGLSDVINALNSQTISKNLENDIPNIKVNPGIYTKVSIDKYGRVISGEKIGINDIPNELIIKINNIESKLINIPSNTLLESIKNDLMNKVNGNKPIIPGTFTKVKVDSKGFVISGEKITINDLPELSISNINGLEKIIRDKADQKDFIILSDTVSSLVDSLSKVGEIPGIKNELNNKASDETVSKISSKVDSIQKTLNSIIDKIPSEMLLEQLNQIQNEIIILSGRLSVIENKFKNYPIE